MNQIKHERFYTDTEFNSGGGKLLSAALVSSTGHRWYEAIELPEGTVLDYWPRVNVIPLLGTPQLPRASVLKSLAKFISQFDSITLVMDNNTDANHFAKLFEELQLTTLINMEFVRPRTSVKTLSKTPHNALSDAYGLMEAMLGSTSVDHKGIVPRDVYTQLEAKGIGLNANNSEYEVVALSDSGDFIVKVYPTSNGSTRKTLDRWTDNYDHCIGCCFVVVPR